MLNGRRKKIMITKLDRFVRNYMKFFPFRKGKSRLVRYASFKHTPGDSIVCQTQFGAQMDLELAQYVDACIYYMGIYEKHILEIIELLSDEYSLDFMLDIGANIGQHSLFGSIICGLNVKAFEADIDTCAKLKKNVELNDKTKEIGVEHLALSDMGGMVEIVVDDIFNSGKSYITSAGQQGGTEKLVRAMRLDDYISQNFVGSKGIIKIDVEGAEGLILRGANDLLNSGKIKAVIVEIIDANLDRFGDTPRGVCDYMISCGYVPWEIQENSTYLPLYDRIPPRCDMLFMYQD